MAKKKVILIAEPEFSAAVAMSCAFLDPEIDVLMVSAAAGHVDPETATCQIHSLIELLDPDRLPRIGTALPFLSATKTCPRNGNMGLEQTMLKPCSLHNPHPSDKFINEEIRRHAGEITILALGPLTALARAFDRDIELPRMIKNIVIVGGTQAVSGHASPCAECHMFFDPIAARKVLHSGVPITMLPLDRTRSIHFSPSELDQYFGGSNAACQTLKKMLIPSVHAQAQTTGQESLYLEDVFGVVALVDCSCYKAKPITVDIEVHGELTRGMTVIDDRPHRQPPNVDWVLEVDHERIRQYLKRTLNEAKNGK